MPSGARAKARAERERLAAQAAAQRAAHAAAAVRRRELIDRLDRFGLRRLSPSRRRRGRQTGALAVRRRTRTRLLVGVLILINVLVWFVEPSWAARAFALVASVLVAPVLYTVLFRKA